MQRNLAIIILLLGLLFIAIPGAAVAQDTDDEETSETEAMDMDESEDEGINISNTMYIAAVLSVVGVVIAHFVFKSYFGFEPLDYAIIGLTLFTALVHVRFGTYGEQLLLLNGIGYSVLLGVLYFPRLRRFQLWVIAALVVYTLITIVGYVVDHGFDHVDYDGYITKIAEVLLLVPLALKAK